MVLELGYSTLPSTPPRSVWTLDLYFLYFLIEVRILLEWLWISFALGHGTLSDFR